MFIWSSFIESFELTNNADLDKYSHSGFGTEFDWQYPFSNFDFGKNIFSVDNSSIRHTDNRKKYILFLDEGPIQALDSTTIMFY